MKPTLEQNTLAVGAALEVWRRAYEAPDNPLIHALADEAVDALDRGDWAATVLTALAARCELWVRGARCGRTVGHTGPCDARLRA